MKITQHVGTTWSTGHIDEKLTIIKWYLLCVYSILIYIYIYIYIYTVSLFSSLLLWHINSLRLFKIVSHSFSVPFWLVGRLVFNGISTFDGYLMSNLVHIHTHTYTHTQTHTHTHTYTHTHTHIYIYIYMVIIWFSTKADYSTRLFYSWDRAWIETYLAAAKYILPRQHSPNGVPQMPSNQLNPTKQVKSREMPPPPRDQVFRIWFRE